MGKETDSLTMKLYKEYTASFLFNVIALAITLSAIGPPGRRGKNAIEQETIDRNQTTNARREG